MARSTSHKSASDEDTKEEQKPLIEAPGKSDPGIDGAGQPSDKLSTWWTSVEQARGDRRNINALVEVIQTGPQRLAAAAAELCSEHESQENGSITQRSSA